MASKKKKGGEHDFCQQKNRLNTGDYGSVRAMWHVVMGWGEELVCVNLFIGA